MTTDDTHIPARRDALIRRVVQETIERRAGGETLSDEAVRKRHPELMPELGKELALLRLIEHARQSSDLGATRGLLGSSEASAGAHERGVGGAEQPSGLPRFPGYLTVRATGRGGQAVVYEALQLGTGRRVAIKFMREAVLDWPGGGEWGADEDPRFSREVRALAQIDHPGVVGIIESGSINRHPFFVMPFIDGVALDHFVQARRQSVRDGAALGRDICRAVAAAHVRGIVHRDLKPANVLVDGDGRPHVLDFGLARVVEEHRGSESYAATMTAAGQFVGSAPWASPEQARGDAARVDTRTDVHALGLLLHHVLTGAHAYPISGGTADVLNRIIHDEPVRPGSLRRGIGPDLEAIVLRAIAKDPARRYQSASELEEDLDRFLRGEPVIARPPSLSHMTRVFARKHKVLVAALAAGLVALGIGLTAALVQLRRAHIAEGRITEELAESRRQSYIARIFAADGALRVNDGKTAMESLDAAPADLRGWEWSHLRARADQSAEILASSGVSRAATSRDGSHVWVMHVSGELACRRLADKSEVWRRGSMDAGSRLVVSPSGRVLLAFDRQVCEVLDAMDGHGLFTWSGVPKRRIVHDACVSADERTLVLLVHEGSLVESKALLLTFDLATGTPAGEFCQDGRWQTPNRIVPHPTLSRVYVSWYSNVATEHALEDGRVLREFHAPTAKDGAWSVCALSPDGKHLALSVAQEITLFRTDDGEPDRTFPGHTQRIDSLEFDPTGRWIVSGSEDCSIRVWDTAGTEPTRTLLGHRGPTEARFAGSPEHVLSFGTDHTLRAWETRTLPAVRVWSLDDSTGDPGSGPVRSVTFAPDGRSLFALRGVLQGRIDLDSGLADIKRRTWGCTNIAPAAPDLRRGVLYWCNEEQHTDRPWIFTVAAFSLEDGRTLWSAQPQDEKCFWCAVSTDGTAVAQPSAFGRVAVRDTRDGHVLFEVALTGEETWRGLFTQDGTRLITGGDHGTVTVWDRSTGAKIADVARTGESITELAITADGKTLAAASGFTGRVRLWDLSGPPPWRVLGDMQSGTTETWALAFSPDGTRLASGSLDRLIRIWDVPSRTQVLQLRGHTDNITSLIWSPDGRALASGGHDGKVMLWGTECRSAGGIVLRVAAPFCSEKGDARVQGRPAISWPQSRPW